MEQATEVKAKQKIFAKVAHLFAHRKGGVQKRFEQEYVKLADKIRVAWTTDLLKMEQELKQISKYNAALATTKMNRTKEMAEEAAREVIGTVFAEWRREINRIVTDLGGYPQEDGNVLFPDGSVAKMPKGLYIPPEQLLKFSS